VAATAVSSFSPSVASRGPVLDHSDPFSSSISPHVGVDALRRRVLSHPPARSNKPNRRGLCDRTDTSPHPSLPYATSSPACWSLSNFILSVSNLGRPRLGLRHISHYGTYVEYPTCLPPLVRRWLRRSSTTRVCVRGPSVTIAVFGDPTRRDIYLLIRRHGRRRPPRARSRIARAPTPTSSAPPPR